VDYWTNGNKSSVSFESVESIVTLSYQGARSFSEVAATPELVVPATKAEFLAACAKSGFDPPLLTADDSHTIIDTYAHGMHTLERIEFKGRRYSVSISAKRESTDAVLDTMSDGQVVEVTWGDVQRATVSRHGSYWVVIGPVDAPETGTLLPTNSDEAQSTRAFAMALREARVEELPLLFRSN
jgi:hypothetical protein